MKHLTTILKYKKTNVMKRNLIILIGLAVTVVSIGQGSLNILPEKDSITPPEFTVEKATWLGPDIRTISEYLKSYTQYPEDSEKQRLVGTEIVEFVVTSTGVLTDFRVINSVSDEIDKEMIRVLKETRGLWNPGLINGTPVPMKKEVSLTFVPNDSYDLIEIAKKNLEQGNEKLFVEKNPKGALEYYNQAVVILPYEKYILALRSLCKNELGDKQGAREDWERIINMGMGDAQQLETGHLIIKSK